MVQAITHETRTIVARQIRRVYARTWHWVDPRDIEQQAHLHMLEAEALPHDEIAEPGAFLWAAVSREIVVWLWKQSKPITVTKYAVKESKKNLALYAAMVFDEYRDQAVQDLAAEIERAQWIAAVQARMRELLDDEESEAVSILLGDKRSRDVAKDGNVAHVYTVTQRVRRRFKRDADLQRLWLDR